MMMINLNEYTWYTFRDGRKAHLVKISEDWFRVIDMKGE
jgi:hypothetical protein